MTKKAKEQVDLLKMLLDVEDVPEKDVMMTRFGAPFRIRAIDGDLLNQIQEQCTYSRIGKKGKQEKHLDETKFQAMIIEKACIAPNWGDKALLDKYKVFEGYEVISKRLLAGEIVKLSGEIMDLSGFGEEDQIESVKN